MGENKGIAIEYSGEIPRIIAIARGKLLKKMVEIAEQYNITVYKDQNLAEILSQLEIGSTIPEDLFKAMAEILAYCYKINENFKEKMNRLDS